MAKQKSQKQAPKPSQTQTQPPPSWPPFKPSLPLAPLEPSPHPAAPSTILLVPRLFPRSLCRDYVSFLRTLPLTTTPGKPKKGDAVRVNDRFQVDDPVFAQRLYNETGLRDVFEDEGLAHLWGGQVIGLNPNIRVYRYSPSQFFDCHYDDSNTLTLPPSNTPAKTTWTLLLYLTSASEGCQGGETVFYQHDRRLEKESISVSPETGLALLHKHGHDCLLHEGKEVTAGEKWILRTDVCVKR